MRQYKEPEEDGRVVCLLACATLVGLAWGISRWVLSMIVWQMT
jgi:hypothetical protein